MGDQLIFTYDIDGSDFTRAGEASSSVKNKLKMGKGLVRSEGKDYVMKDGDVVLFRFNV